MPNEVIVRGAVLPLTEKARDRFAQEQVDLIAASVAPNGTPLATIHRFLELSARYELDPFAGEIWCALMAGKDGASGRVAILVGRDGYLKVARRDPIFIDVDADVVYEKDEFKVVRTADGSRTVEHSYGNPAQRGNALGAYAVLRREGKPDRYFYAPLHQYAKNADKSAWSYRDAMIVKCATSYIARTTYGISGPVPADEVNGGLALPSDGPDAGVIEGRAAEGSLLPGDLADMVARAHALDPKAWRENEVLARLDGTPEVEQAVRVELAAWLDEHEPEEAEVVDEAGGPASDATNGHTIEDEERRAEVQARYESDEEWRTKVDVLLHRRADLEASASEMSAPNSASEDINAELDVIDQELDALGVPRGWMPVAEGQASLEV
jgi:hypothetical protein